MAWPYRISFDQTDAQKHERRVLLDRYGVYAQLSALIPIAIYQLYRLAIWVSLARRRSQVKYSAVPGSPDLKHGRGSKSGVLERKWREVRWWAEGEIWPGLGLKGQWVAGLIWAGWLGFLCVHRTGVDYLHVTKRFGIIAVSQLPLHYMLAMKGLYSPLALVFRVSHEDLNTWHRISARILYALLICHASLYLNLFYQVGALQKRLTQPVVLFGELSFLMLTILMFTSFPLVREWSYRVFFVCHLVIGVCLMPMLFFHAKPLRVYVVEALVLFLFDLVCRKLDTFTGFATITQVPNTKLVKVKIPVPASKMRRFAAAAGQHIYLQVPAESTPPNTGKPSIHDVCYNPFTVAEVSDTDITVVLRTLSGPTTKALDSLTRLSKARPPLNIEGPLGASKHFPNLARDYDRILLVAGGVGATFILPIYHSIQDQLMHEGKSPDRATFTWSMRSTHEATWAVSSTSNENPLSSDENIKIYLTPGFADDGEQLDENLLPIDGSVEMADLAVKEGQEGVKVTGRKRPDLKGIVDECFRMGSEESVAVLVCGPKGMARELKACVGEWVGRGRRVWFHDEGFGW